MIRKIQSKTRSEWRTEAASGAERARAWARSNGEKALVIGVAVGLLVAASPAFTATLVFVTVVAVVVVYLIAPQHRAAGHATAGHATAGHATVVDDTAASSHAAAAPAGPAPDPAVGVPPGSSPTGRASRPGDADGTGG